LQPSSSIRRCSSVRCCHPQLLLGHCHPPCVSTKSLSRVVASAETHGRQTPGSRLHLTLMRACMDAGCEDSVLRKDADRHASETCAYRKNRCAHCANPFDDRSLGHGGAPGGDAGKRRFNALARGARRTGTRESWRVVMRCLFPRGAGGRGSDFGHFLSCV